MKPHKLLIMVEEKCNEPAYVFHAECVPRVGEYLLTDLDGGLLEVYAVAYSFPQIHSKNYDGVIVYTKNIKKK